MQTDKIIPPQNSHLGLFNTASGNLIDLNNPHPSEINIEDIAHALSNICRFGGHAGTFYSVAQHCCLVTGMVPHEAKKMALLHDASEAYLGDVIKPLKNIIGASYTSIEDRFTQLINQRFQIKPSSVQALEVKKADSIMLEIEHEALILGKPARLVSLLHGCDQELGWAWKPMVAKDMFLTTFHKLFSTESAPKTQVLQENEG